MIKYISSTVFNSGAQTITNTINCVGVMGTGLALEFKLRFPDMFIDYKKRCEGKNVKVGEPYLFDGYLPEQLIYNFPTKNHWKNTSKLEWIVSGLKHFKKHYMSIGIKSIAFPKLGARSGRLEWETVRKVMIDELNDLKIEIIICLDEEQFASGLEDLMIKNINFAAIDNKKLTKIVNRIDSINIYRFSDIRSLKSISKNEYEEIFKACYKMSIVNQPSFIKQLSLFKVNE